MPKIRTYERQVGTPDPTIKSSASPEAAGAFGKGLATAAGAFSNASDQFLKVAEDREKTEVVKALSTIEANFDIKIREQKDAGTLDTQKIQDEYKNEINKIVGSVNTSAGKDYLDKQSTLLGNSLLKTSSLNQAQMFAEQDTTDFLGIINTDYSGLLTNPLNHMKKLTRIQSLIKSKLDSKRIGQKEADKFNQMAIDTYGDGAVRGFARTSPKLAQMKLDSLDNLSPDVKKNLISHIRTMERANKLKQKSDAAKIKEARKIKSENWQMQNYARVVRNEISVDEILDSNELLPQDKTRMLRIHELSLNKSLKLDPLVFNKVIKDIQSGRISDPSELYEYVGKGLRPSDPTRLLPLVMNAAGRINDPLKESRSKVIQAAEKEIVSLDTLNWTMPVAAQKNLTDFYQFMLKEEDRLSQKGEDTSSLYDPSSKNYILNKIDQFKVTSKQILENTIDDDDLKDDDLIQPGEDLDKYLERKGLGG